MEIYKCLKNGPENWYRECAGIKPKLVYGVLRAFALPRARGQLWVTSIALSFLPSSPGQIPLLPNPLERTALRWAVCEPWQCFPWITIVPHLWSLLFIAIYPSSCEFRQQWHFVFFQLLIYQIGQYQITSVGTTYKKHTQFISNSLFKFIGNSLTTMTFWYFN